MLTIEIKANGIPIDFINIHNQGYTLNPKIKDECTYRYARNSTDTSQSPKIYHGRDRGWELLVIKVLNHILKTKRNK